VFDSFYNSFNKKKTKITTESKEIRERGNEGGKTQKEGLKFFVGFYTWS